ncbi:lecithin retinol acyltransferase family protein [Vibrio sp.]|nr:lecithin retinol acyltransferase family protein [Vibrio sp.]
MAIYQLGDHLVTNIDILGATEHHGIYTGNNQVIHLSQEAGCVIQSTLCFFANHQTIRRKKPSVNPELTVELAESLLGQKGYNLLTNNCEQFVNYCMTHRHTSNQISNVGHAICHLAAKQGLLGVSTKVLSQGVFGTVTIASTGAKYMGEYIGLPDDVNTLMGASGDLIAKPLETALIGSYDTLTSSFNKLSEGEVIEATESLITGSLETLVDVTFSPIYVLGDAYFIISSWFD